MTQYKRVLFSHSCVAYLMKPMRNDRNIPVNAVEDPYLQIRKGGGGGGHPDHSISGGGSSKKKFWPFGPQFCLRIRGGEASPGSVTEM